MRAPLPLPHIRPHVVGWRSVFHMTKDRRQVLLDKLAVVAVLLLVLAIFTMIGLYIAHQLPLWRAGEIAGAESIQSPSSQTSGAPQTTASVAPTLGLGRVPLVLISMVINMAIFVCLGLYLRREMNRLP